MPVKRKPVAKPKRRYVRKARRYVKRRPILRTLTPNHIIRKLNYYHKSTIANGTIDFTGGTLLRATSLYDPWYSAGGGQPRGFDQYMLLYQKYLVLGAKITVSFFSRSGSLVPCQVGVCLSNETSIKSSLQDYYELPGSTIRTLAPKDAGKAICHITKFYSAKKWFHLRDVQDYEELKATSSTNPSKNCYFHIFIQNTDPGYLADTTDVIINVQYVAKFMESVDPGSS